MQRDDLLRLGNFRFALNANHDFFGFRMAQNLNVSLPPPFKGDSSQKVREWFSSYARICTANELDANPDRRLVILPALLEGSAIQFYETLQIDNNTTFQNVRDQFEREFAVPNEPEVYFNKLSGRWQKEGESVETFAEVVRVLIRL